MTNSVPPGWYPDPHDPTQEHWWDGTRYHGTRTANAASTMPGGATVPPPRTPENTEVGGYTPFRGGVPSPKSRTVASILGFFLGGFGVDRFYLGNIGMGVCKLLFGVFTFGIWPLVDWIIIISGAAHDGQGLPVTNWDSRPR